MLNGDAQPLPAFLGIAQRVLRRNLCWDLMGVSTSVFLPCFPQRLDGLALCLAIPATETSSELTFEFREEGNTGNAAWTGLRLQIFQPDTQAASTETLEDFSTPARRLHDVYNGDSAVPLAIAVGGTAHLLPIPCPPLMVWQPCRIIVDVIRGAQRSTLGTLLIGFVQTPPLSDDERRSLLQDIGAHKHLRLVASCKKCGDKMYLTASLEGPMEPTPKADGSSFSLETAPDDWTCKCRTTRVPLNYAKLSFHHLFRTLKHGKQPFSATFVPHFEHQSLEAIIDRFSKLIRSNPNEEDVQQFMAGHSIVWSFLSYTRIELKPSILTRYKADFAILSTDRTLYFVELEKPQTPLTKATGGIHSELQKGLNQVNDWRRIVRTDQRAVLSELGFRQEEVESIKFVLIAGLSSTLSPGDLGTIREGMAPDVTLLTFDDLEARLRRVQHTLSAL